MPITMTIITNGLLSAEPKPLGNCNIVVANIFPADFLPFPLYFQAAGDSNSIPRVFPASTYPTRSLLVLPCGRPARPSDSEQLRLNPSCVRPATLLRPDPPRSARASQMRISLGFQTR